MKFIFALFILFATGCTQLLVREPIGSNFTSEQLDDFNGAWLLSIGDEEDQIIEIKSIDENGTFKVAYVEWDEENKKFALDETEIILKKGREYGILHLRPDEDEDSDYLIITLFKIQEDDKIVYWMTDTKPAEEFLKSGSLKTEIIDEELIIIDEPQRIIEELESKHDLIFDQEKIATLTKIK